MGVNVHWHDKARGILLLTYGKQWSWLELYEALQLRTTMLRLEGFTRYHVIHDLGAQPYVPHYALPNAYHIIQRSRPALQTVTVVTPSLLLKRLIEAGHQLYPDTRNVVQYAPDMQTAQDALDRFFACCGSDAGGAAV